MVLNKTLFQILDPTWCLCVNVNNWICDNSSQRGRPPCDVDQLLVWHVYGTIDEVGTWMVGTKNPKKAENKAF